MDELNKKVLATYDWGRFISGLLIGILVLIFFPKKEISISFFFLILVFSLLDSFRSAQLTQNEIELYRIFFGKKKYRWSEIKSVERIRGIKENSYYKIVTTKNKKYFFFSNPKVDNYLIELDKSNTVRVIR
jgi:hypothetical protein